MSVATSTAIGIGLAAASAGASVASAKMQSNAAKEAAKTQQRATDRAIGVQTQANQPYMDLGRESAARLSQMKPQPYTQTFGSGAGAQAWQPPMDGTLASLGGGATGRGAMPPPGMQGAPRGGPQAMVSPSGGGQMVQMQAPDGSVRPVPMAMVDELTRRGAKRVG